VLTTYRLVVLLSFCLASTLAVADHRMDRRGRGVDVDVHINPGIGQGHNRSRHNNSIFNRVTYGVGYTGYGGRYYLNSGLPTTFSMGWNQPYQAPLVIQYNTYIEQPSTNTRLNKRSTRNSGVSLLRDIHGRCFERVVDAHGNETRTQLDAAACNF
jgi:hypothetical protein